MTGPLQRLPLSVLLLPLFFVLHGFIEHRGYVGGGEALALAGLYVLCSLAVFGLLWLWFRNIVKAALGTSILIAGNFFFGAMQDFLRSHVPALSHYSVMLPAIAGIIAAGLLALQFGKRSFLRANLFINILLIVYIFVDAARLPGGARRDRDFKPVTVGWHRCDTCARPNIYLLVFDAYQGSRTLRERYGYDNGAFDRFLDSAGFHIQHDSHANYKYTILSMPSILNMNYLSGLDSVKGGPVEEYYYLSDRIRDNEFLRILHSMDYEVVNCSPFDLKGNPSPLSESILPLKTRLITDQTLWSRAVRDIGWHVFQFTTDPFSRRELYRDMNNNQKLLDAFHESGGQPSTAPKFVYLHLNLPHPPYYFDRNLMPKTVRSLYQPSDEDDTAAYKDYLPYTNRVAKTVISQIRRADPTAVIVFMGDHGLRFHDTLGFNPPWFVQNQNAVYLPTGNYRPFYDSISGVNELRAVLNGVFEQDIPLLKDSIVNVKDKK